MKTHLTITLAGFMLLARAYGQNQTGPVMRDASTNAQLTLEYRKALQNNPMSKMQPAKGNDPSLANQPEDLVASSDFLCFGGIATLIPKRAVLNVPKNLVGRMTFQPGSQIRGWADFYALNRGWITTVEVSRTQAEGNQEIKAEITERIGKSSNLVVATYMGGPISVLPLKVTEKKEADAATQTINAKQPL
jgi:hypothetical protein